jgi:hypothetical protein
MFNISKSFESDHAVVYSIAGSITDDELSEWTSELVELFSREPGPLVLNFREVVRMSPQAIRIVALLIEDRVSLIDEPSGLSGSAGRAFWPCDAAAGWSPSA